MSTVELDNYHWLVSQQALPYFSTANDSDRSILSLTQQLRRELSLERAHLVLEQVELRRRATEKFSQAERMFFTRQLLEQSTDEQIAEYKASRFPRASLVADLCCGIGGDLQALARRTTCFAIDKDPVALLFAERNCGETSISLRVESCDVRDIAESLECAAWHIDPDRRSAGSRTSSAEFAEPGIDVLQQLTRRTPDGAIKLAPAAAFPSQISDAFECEWISSRRECRQQVAWLGELARRPGQHTATTIDRHGTPHTFSAVPNLPCSTVSPLHYLFDLDPAVVASRLVGAIAEEHGLSAVGPSPSYLTGDALVDDPLLTAFEVVDVVPLDTKRLKTTLQDRRIGSIEIKVRGVDIDPPSLRRRVQPRGSAAATLLIFDSPAGVRAALANRLG